MGTNVAVKTQAEALHGQLERMRPQLQATLPPDVDVDRFTRVVMIAVQRNPQLLDADTDKPSLYLACSEAASDGLLPDGKQGALVMYGKKVQWQRMIGGLRHIAGKHGFDLRAEIVCKNDAFDYVLGDEPKILHKPALLGEERGEIIGAYAIAKNIATGETWREVMDRKQIDKIRSISKSGGNGPWGQWFDEQARKTVAKRLFKQLPLQLDEREQGVFERDNEDSDLGRVVDTQTPSSPLDASHARGSETDRGAPKRPRGLQSVIDQSRPAPEPQPAPDVVEDESPI